MNTHSSCESRFRPWATPVVESAWRGGSDSSHQDRSRRAADFRQPMTDIRRRMQHPRRPIHWLVLATMLATATATATATAPPGEVTSSAVDPRLEACKIRMTSPAKHEWTTWWDPKGVALSGEGPSSVHSSYWASKKEKETLRASKAAMPLDINCSNEGPPEI